MCKYIVLFVFCFNIGAAAEWISGGRKKPCDLGKIPFTFSCCVFSYITPLEDILLYTF